MTTTKLALLGGARAVPKGTAMPPWPVVTAEDKEAVERVLTSGKFTSASAGETEIPALEEAWASRVGVRHCTAMSNGTSALAIALAALGVGPGDEVVVPALSFIATALAPVHLGALPVFVDVDPVTFNLDARSFEAAIGDRTRAVIPVHLHGLPADMDEINAIATRRRIAVIEDAAQAHGVTYRNKPVGGHGHVGVFSLNVSKNLPTCGEGGLVTTDDSETNERMTMMRQFGERLATAGEREYVSRIVGWNAKMNTMQAAFTRSQLARFSADEEARDKNVRAFLARIDGLTGLTIPRVPADRGHGWHILRFRLEHAPFERPAAWVGSLRAAVLRTLRAEGVPVSRYQSVALSGQPVFRGDRGSAAWTSARSRSLPTPHADAVIEASFTLQKAHLHPGSGPLLSSFADAFIKVWEHREFVVRMADEAFESGGAARTAMLAKDGWRRWRAR